MKKILFFCWGLALLSLVACRQKEDAVVAEVNGKKLYASQLQELAPTDMNPHDSAVFMESVIKNWVMEQLLLKEAGNELSLREKDFSKELKAYRERLVLQTYVEKITADTSLFPVTDKEIRDFMRHYGMHYSVEKEIIKLNYVKLAKNSKLIPEMRTLLFDEENRQTKKNDIERLCGDSIEFFIEDDRWLYLEDIEFEFPFQLSDKEKISDENRYVETEDKEFHYLIVLLDYRQRQSAAESADNDYENARNLLRQQKKEAYIQQKKEELYRKAGF